MKHPLRYMAYCLVQIRSMLRGFMTMGSNLMTKNANSLPSLEYLVSIRYLGDTVKWYVSFLPEKSTQKFIEGLFLNQIFEIGDNQSLVQFQIIYVETLPEPDYSEEMEFETQSPMCIKLKTEYGRMEYLSPKDVRAPYLIFSGLLDRYKIFYGKSLPNSPFDFKFEVLSEPKSSLILIKAGTAAQTRVRGYHCRFKVKAPVEIMKIIYSSGIGVQNSVGFGCVEVK